MTINEKKSGNIMELALVGRLDTKTAPQLEQVANSSLEGIEQLTIDLQGLDYLSSAGLRVLLLFQKKMNKQGSMAVKNVNETIMEVFEITGFVDVLDIQ